MNVEEERLRVIERVIEEERLDRLRLCIVKNLMGPVLLDKLGEPGLVEKIVEAM